MRCCFICLSLVLAILVSSSAIASGAVILTFQQAVRETLDRSEDIKLKIYDIHIATATYHQNRGGLLPRISLNSRAEYSDNLDTDNPGINSINGEIIGGSSDPWRSGIYLLGQYNLSSLYKDRFEVKYYNKLRKVAENECEIEVKKLILKMMDIYGNVYEGIIKKKYALCELQLLQRILDLTEQAKALGESSGEDVLKTGNELLNLKQDSILISKYLKENTKRLCFYVGLDFADGIKVEAFRHVDPDSGDVNKSIQNMPEYKARASETEALEFRSSATRYNFWPDISLYGRYDLYGSDAAGPDKAFRDIHDAACSVGLVVNMALFDGGSQKWARRKSQYELLRQKRNIKAVAREKKRDLGAFQASYFELSKSIKYQRQLIDSYRQLMDMTRTACNLGEKNEIDVLKLKRDILNIERDLALTQNQKWYYANILFAETNLKEFIHTYYGDWTCQH